MRRFSCRIPKGITYLLLGLALLYPSGVLGEKITLKNGVQIEGRLGKIGKLGESSLAISGGGGAVDIKSIVLVDDDLRRTFFPSLQVQAIGDEIGIYERILTNQRVSERGRRLGGIGDILKITPFDQYGRRTVTLQTPRKVITIVQGITIVTPIFCRIQGLQGTNPYVWDMRIATSSIPRATLSAFLRHHLDPKNSDDRLRIVRLYLQSERIHDAGKELEGILKDFPELTELKKQVVKYRQVGAQRLLKEIELRGKAGQHRLAINMLQGFPNKGIAGETLIEVREKLAQYSHRKDQGDQVLELLKTHTASIQDGDLKTRVQVVVDEITRDLNINTLNRMADYLRLSDDKELGNQEKLALAISGWLLGSGSGIENLAVALSAFRVRNLAQKYLRASGQSERDLALADLESLEAGTPSYMAKIVAHMKPAIANQQDFAGSPKLMKLSVPGLSGQARIEYYVQLPQEYDPYRRYPCIVTLNGSGTSPQQQIDWWAGSYNEKIESRLGQATRYGYVVIAPVWAEPSQHEYKFSAREHAAVLYSLRDVCRRFSIDTDRVFLSGHSMGGTAAWDIGIAHPDLWAGLIPIVATTGKYISRYWSNARSLPLYFVGGSMDGDRMSINSTDLNRYMIKVGYDVMVVEYQGRGHEHFSDEILRIFNWMNRHKRNFFPREFKTVSMRPWDNFFWWAELSGFPPKSMVKPLEWHRRRGARPVSIEGRILETNGIVLRSGADNTTIWLSPEIIDFSKQITINSRRVSVTPTAQVLLKDVRTRGDRLHPFWAKVELKNGRVQ